MKEPDIVRPPRPRFARPWLALLWAALLCAPVVVQAQGLSGMRVLPHSDPEYSFGGWQSEGDMPPLSTVPLELGDEIYGATLQLQPESAGVTYRVSVQFETSLGLSAEGPHLDLTDWKHCVSDWAPAHAIDAVSFVLPKPSPGQQACFPHYTRAELDQAVHAYAAAQGEPAMAGDWLARIDENNAASPVSPFVAISAVRVKVEALRNGNWVQVATVVFMPPMGC